MKVLARNHIVEAMATLGHSTHFTYKANCNETKKSHCPHLHVNVKNSKDQKPKYRIRIRFDSAYTVNNLYEENRECLVKNINSDDAKEISEALMKPPEKDPGNLHTLGELCFIEYMNAPQPLDWRVRDLYLQHFNQKFPGVSSTWKFSTPAEREKKKYEGKSLTFGPNMEKIEFRP